MEHGISQLAEIGCGEVVPPCERTHCVLDMVSTLLARPVDVVDHRGARKPEVLCTPISLPVVIARVNQVRTSIRNRDRTVRQEISSPASNAMRASPIRFLGERSMIREAPWCELVSFSISESDRSSSKHIGYPSISMLSPSLFGTNLTE